VERGVEDGHLGQLGQRRAGRLDAVDPGRVVQRRERDKVADRLQDRVVDERGPGEPWPAVHDPVPDRAQGRHIDQRQDGRQVPGSDHPALRLGRPGRVDDGVLERGRTAVEHQHGHPCHSKVSGPRPQGSP